MKISQRKGHPTAYDGKRHYWITFESISIRNQIENQLRNIDKLPVGFKFELVSGLGKTVAKICYE